MESNSIQETESKWVYLKDVSLEYLRETPFKVEKYSCIAEMDTYRKYKTNEEANREEKIND